MNTTREHFQEAIELLVEKLAEMGEAMTRFIQALAEAVAACCRSLTRAMWELVSEFREMVEQWRKDKEAEDL